MVNLVLSNEVQFFGVDAKFFHGWWFNSVVLGLIIRNRPHLWYLRLTTERTGSIYISVISWIVHTFIIHRRIIGSVKASERIILGIIELFPLRVLNNDQAVVFKLSRSNGGQEGVGVVEWDFVFWSASWPHYKTI